jgi:hypothetical protein
VDESKFEEKKKEKKLEFTCISNSSLSSSLSSKN